MAPQGDERWSLTEAEFRSILDDATKAIEGDIGWEEDEDHSPAVEFRVSVVSTTGYPLSVKGSLNRAAATLTYVLIHQSAGRIYALDLGKEHHNPTCENVGEKHKHAWTEQFRDKHAYVPEDITATVADPAAVWRQFCAETRIIHRGVLGRPPAVQLEFL